ncbi:hypothetical protein Tco_0496519 [Tanacetum coccineum]
MILFMEEIDLFLADVGVNTQVLRVDDVDSVDDNILFPFRIVPAFLKELIYKVLGLHVSLLELNRFEILLDEREEGQVSIVMGGIFSLEARDMDTKLLSAPESNNTLARCCTDLHNALSLHRHDKVHFLHKGRFPVYLVLNMNGSIRFDSFLPSVLLWLVIIVVVVGIGVTVIVVAVVVVESSSVVKLSFMIV